MWNFFKSAFGIPDSLREAKDGAGNNSFNLVWDPEDVNNERNPSNEDPFTFLHTYIERQMQQMEEIFGNDFGPNRFSNFDWNGNHEQATPPSTSTELRDEFLKPGFSHDSPKSDTDLDGKVDSGDIERFLGGPVNSAPRFFDFQSVSVRTIQRPDGSMETVRTVQGSDGREETTVTRQGPSTPLQPIQPPPLNLPSGEDDIISKFFKT